MSQQFARILAVSLVVVGGACAERSSTAPNVDATSLAGAFASAPLGYDMAQSSFDASGGTSGWAPRRDHFGGGFMGGGLSMLFMGGGFGEGFGRGRYGDDIFAGSCTFNAADGRVECAPLNFNGITVVRSVAFTDASGKVQAAFDSLTNAIDTRVSVSGRVVRRDSDVTTFADSSDRSVSGLVKGSTLRVVNGTSAGTETTVGRDSAGQFTAVRTVGDTTRNVTIPVSATNMMMFMVPTAGTVIRQMEASLTYTGKTPVTASRREVVTYNGSDTASVVITQNGTTKTCKLPLPRGRLICQ